MSKFTIDYSNLAGQITKKAYRLSDIKDQLESFAFDVVRFKDSDKSADLWQVQSADDGEYIVALYQPEETEKTSSQWHVSIDKIGRNLHISYKNDPLVSISADKLGIPLSEINKVPAYLPEKLATNHKLVKALLTELPESSKKEILTKYPELL